MERILTALTILAALFALVTNAPISCPTEESLTPCTCKRMAYGLHVVCAKFTDSAALIKSFRVLRDYKVQKVLLHEVNITDVLPSDIFEGMEISELRVEKSKLKFSEPAFTGLDDSLHILNVAQHTMIKSSENFSLARLHRLTELNMKLNPLGTVRDKWLNGKIPNVKNIKLDEDEISVIESRAFADLPNLETISIAENKIKTVERSMFPRPANNLRVIDLSANEIATLPYDFFFEMPNLEEVIFSGNDISTLPEHTWKVVWHQLSTVWLFRNNLYCDERLNWLKNCRWPNHVVAECFAPSNLLGKNLRDVYKT